MAVQENVIIKFDAQTQAALANLAKVAGGFDKIGDAAKRAEGSTNAGLDKLTAGLLKVNLVLATAEKAVQAVGKALEFGKFAEEMDKLRGVVSQKLVGSVQEATNGVIAQTDIMRTAAKALSGDMKLTEEQIVDVFKASKVLADRGFGTATENAEKMFTALRKGTTEAFTEFGVAVDKADTRAGKFSASMQAIQKTASDTSGLRESGDAVAKLIVLFKDLADIIKNALGSAVQFVAGAIEGLRTRTTEDEIRDEAVRLRFADAQKGIRKPWSYYMDRGKQKFSREAVFGRAREAGPAPFTGTDFVSQDWRNGVTGESFQERRFSMTDELFIPDGGTPRATRPTRPRPGPVLERNSDRLADSGNWSPSATYGTSLGALGAGTARESTLADLFPAMGRPSAGGFGSGFSSGLGEVRAELLSLQEAGQVAAQTTVATMQSALQAAVSGQTSMLQAAKSAIGGELAARAVSWGLQGAAMTLTGNPKGLALIALSTAAIVAARAMGGGAAAATAGIPRTSGYTPSAVQSGFGGRQAAGPSNVSFHLRGNGEQNVVQFDAAYRNAKRMGYIPSGEGPSRLVG